MFGRRDHINDPLSRNRPIQQGGSFTYQVKQNCLPWAHVKFGLTNSSPLYLMARCELLSCLVLENRKVIWDQYTDEQCA